MIGASESGGDVTDGPSNLAEDILDQAGDAVIFADRSGTIRRWNRAAAALFGFAAEEALGQNLDLIIPPHLRSAHWRGFDAGLGLAPPGVAQAFDKGLPFLVGLGRPDVVAGEIDVLPAERRQGEQEGDRERSRSRTGPRWRG